MVKFAEDNTSTFLGDRTLYSPTKMSDFGVELGVFYIINLICFGIMLNKVNGRPSRIYNYICTMKFEIFADRQQTPKRVKQYLSVMCWVYLIVPFTTMAVWTVVLIVDALRLGYSIWPAICVVLILAASMMLVLDIMKIKWNNWRFKLVNLVLQSIALSFYTLVQFIIVLIVSPGDTTGDRYLGMSCLFLGMSGICMTNYLYFNWKSMTFNMRQIFRTHFEPGAEELDATRTEDFIEEVMKQKKDELYQPTLKDVIDIFTIGKISTKKMLQAFGGGFQSKLQNFSKCKYFSVNGLLLFMYFALTITYAVIMFFINDRSKMGIVTGVCVMLADFTVIALSKGGIFNRPSLMCLFLLLNRVLIIGGGRYAWSFGLIILYLINAMILSHQIGEKRFKFSDEVAAVDIEQLSKQNRLVDVTKTEEFLLFSLTVAILIGMGAVVAIEPRDVFIGEIYFGTTGLSPFTTLVASVFGLLAISIYYYTYRAFIRKKKNLSALVYYYARNKNIDTFQMCCGLSLLVSVMWSLMFYWASDNGAIAICGFFVPLILIFFCNAFLYYLKNDFRYFKDIRMLNQNIERHNKIVTQMRQKAKGIRRSIRAGTSDILNPDQMGLAVSIIEKNRLEREMRAAMADSKIKSDKVNMRNYKIRKEQELELQVRGSQMNFNKSKTNKTNPITAVATDSITEKQRNDEEWDVNEGGENEEILAQDQSNKGNQDVTNSGDPNNQSQTALLQPLNVKALQTNYNQDSDSELSEDFDASEDKNFLAEDIAKRARCKHKKMYDWRTEYSPCQAFWKGKMRRHDYKLVIFLCGGFISTVLFGMSICFYFDSLTGLIYAMPFIHYGAVIFALARSVGSDAPVTCGETVLLVVAYVLQYAAALFYLVWEYDVSKDFIFTFDDEAMDFKTPVQQEAENFVLYYILILPLISSATGMVLKFLDQDQGLTRIFWGLTVITVLHVIGVITVLFMFMPTGTAITVLVASVGILYAVYQYSMYRKNGYYMSRNWRRFNSIIIFIIVFASLIQSLATEMSIFAGFTMTCAVAAIICLLLLGARLYTDYKQNEDQPVFYSPWLLPAYKFIVRKGKIKKHFQAIYLLLIFSVIGIVWSLACTFIVTPAWVGVCFMVLFESIAHVVVLFLTNQASINLTSVRDLCDDIIIKQAWLDAKEYHVCERVQAMCRKELATYEDWWHRRFYLRNYIRYQEGKKLLRYPESKEFEYSRAEFQEAIDNNQTKDFLYCKLEEFMRDDELEELEANNMEFLYGFQYETDLDLKDAYEQELELVIQFQLTIVQLANTLRKQERKYLFKFLEERKAELFVMGISIDNPSKGNTKQRYSKVIIQLQRLSNDQQTIFNALRDKFILQERENAAKEILAAEMEEQRNEERQAMLAEMSAAKRAKLANIDLNAPIDEIPDCEDKYKKIREMYEADRSYKYKDADFNSDDHVKVLGEKVNESLPQRGLRDLKFVRASEISGAVLYSDGVSHRDVQQGALGDCYFLSAISVLGGPNVKDIILEEDNEQWRETGCFMLRFFKDGQPEVVIIDDYLPVDATNKPAFCRGGPEGLELWPAILEKGYAKMYSSYSFIEAGKVQIALADMTDGFPEQLELRNYSKNLQLFWEKLLSLYRKGTLMGAGSPEHERGDQAVSEQGIVQGHAYAILQVVQYDKHKLIQLRNPHGETSQTKEWIGDWSDNSENWDERAIRKLKYKPQDSPDGIFWMSAMDFLQNFKYLYCCRILNERRGWKEAEFFGEWKGKSSAGFPGKFYNLPQYKITVTKPCDGFISLRQHDKITTFKGKNYIGWFCMKERGKKVAKFKRENLVAKAGLSNLNVVTGECDFPNTLDYPYSFTLMVGSQKPGVAGQGKFDLSIYTTDPKMKVEKLK